MARNRLCVGIDIGSSAVKVCQLRRNRSGYALQTFGMVAVPSETVVDGTLMNSARIVDAIQELVASHRIKEKQVALSISGHAVIIKKIPLPQMTREELEEQILIEAEQFIPFDIRDVNLDVQIVNTQSTQQGHMDVVLVAAKKDYVNEYTSVIAEAGLDPVVCDIDAFAVENCFQANHEALPGQSTALVNIGASKTNINIIVGNVSTFTRDMSVGGNTFTDEIMRQMAVSRDEAEALKIGGRSDGGTGVADAVVPHEVETALRSIAETVTTEIQRSFDFYAATSADPPPSRVLLSGGTARLPALVHALSNRLGVPVVALDPFQKIDVNPSERPYIESLAPAAAVAVGLAMRYAGDRE